MTQEPIRLATRAKITRAEGIDADKMLALAKASAPDPSVFGSFAPLFWRVRASSNRLDFYHTRMRPGRTKTLGNFERMLKEGVSYQNSHDWTRNGWGQSLDGRTITTDEIDREIGEPVVEVWGDFFTLSGLSLEGQHTDHFGAAIRAGVWRDVSVGFFASDIECGLCGKQSFEWWKEDGCTHIPGVEYELATGEGDTIRAVAWAWINDGELSEVSQVFDGATPGAAVAKAEQMSLEGQLPEETRAKVERRYQVRLATPQRRYTLGGLPLIERGGEQDMALKRGITKRAVEDETPITPDGDEETPITPIDSGDETPEGEETPVTPGEGEGTEEPPEIGDETVITDPATEEEPEGDEEDGERGLEHPAPATAPAGDVLAEERARLRGTGIDLGRDPVKAVRALASEVLRLRPLADDGKRYRKDLESETLAAGARAYGPKFHEERYRGILAQLDLEGIRELRDTFNARGDQQFGGGRQTIEDAEDSGTDEEPVNGKTKRQLDPDRFKA